MPVFTTPIRGHGPARTSHTSRRDVAGTARVYMLDEPALTLEAVMAARGWDRRHCRYRRMPSVKGRNT